MPRQQPRRQNRQPARASLTPESALAITQQGLLFVVAAVGETAFSRSEVKDATPGRPGLVPIAGLSAVTVLGVVIIKAGVDQLGLGIGSLGTAGIAAYSLKRVLDTPFVAEDWPGKKAWPGLTLLLAFFATWAFTQGLASSFA